MSRSRPSLPQNRPNAHSLDGASFAVPSRRLVLAVLAAFLIGGVVTLVLVDRILRFDSQAVATGVTLAATIVATAATVALAWFGWAQVSAERQRRESDQRTAAARLSANAFELRQELAVWVLRSQEKGWAGANTVAQKAMELAARLLDPLEQGLVDASAASPALATRVQKAYAYLQRAKMQFEAYLGQYYETTQAQVHGVDAAKVTPADTGLLDSARENIRGCCNELEQVVEPALLAEAKRLSAWRAV